MLSEENRTKLDGIVQKMTQDNQPYTNIQAVVSDFKNKYDTLPTQPQQQPGFLQKLGTTLFGGFASPGITGTGGALGDVGTGVAKSYVRLPFETAQLGEKVASGVGIPKGSFFNPGAPATPNVFQNKSMGEQIGSTAGDISQFFIPGPAEAKVGTTLDKLIDVGKLTDRFGPEAAKVIKTMADIAGKAGITGASMGGVEAVQSGGDVGKTATAAITGGVAGGLSKALEVFSPGFSQALTRAGFKMTPATEAKLGSKAEDAATFMSQNKIIGSEGSKLRQLSTINNEFENAVQNSIGNEVKISKDILKKEIDAQVETFKVDDPAIYQSALRDAEGAKKTIDATPGTEVGLNDVLKGKRSWGSQAFKTKGAQKLGSLQPSEGAYAIEQGYENALEQGMVSSGKNIKLSPGLQKYFGGKTEVSIPEFNKIYGKAITAKKLTYAAQLKKDSSLVGRLFGLWAGRTLGYAVSPTLGGEIIGATAGEMAATHLPGFARAVGEYGAAYGSKVVNPIAKVGMGLANPSGTSDQNQ